MIKNFPLYRVVFPTKSRIESTIDCIPIYIESEISKVSKYAKYIKSRTQIEIPRGENISFCSYFNAFPASYWKNNTSLETVTLIMEVKGLVNIRILATDEFNNKKIISDHKKVSEAFEISIPLDNFEAGGWIWFEIETLTKTNLDNIIWAGNIPDNFGLAKASIGITTLNKQEYCLAQLKNLFENINELDNINKIYFVDQGSKDLVDYKGIKDILVKFNKKVEIIKQSNFGGSGGFSRGMFEIVKADNSKYAILLDDDTFLETESLQRIINFANLCQSPTIVGGHMFAMNESSTIHAFAEGVRRDVFKWGPVAGTGEAHNLAMPQNFLSNSEWMHKYYSVDYNGWWMCLIPVEVIKEIGLAVPMFIKWDDSEFGLRAADFGYKTVSLPGCAVWHESWVGKDDTIDWTAFYHWRNRFIVALFYLGQKQAGKFLINTYIWSITQAATMRYSVPAQYVEAMEFLYNNPENMIDDLADRKLAIEKIRAQYIDTDLKDLAKFNTPRYKTNNSQFNVGNITKISSLFFGLCHQLLPIKKSLDNKADYYIPQRRAYWWRLPNLDSAIVASNISGKASLFIRDRKQFFDFVLKLTKLHFRIYKDWGKLHKKYMNARLTMSSFDRWSKLFDKTKSKKILVNKRNNP
ncbi:MAG: glycosyltransferase [Bifidobacteriaceae bacterium]|jgi:galactofuranosylgalactofuranosylrhamnosyl-N-acetylglucosaminyl-diphospho-decaprenol beta-1,5/1,6-galactofuranosyltransferase|nr:glycosyltransferase [Bifidobacteriaceae bacterium]